MNSEETKNRSMFCSVLTWFLCERNLRGTFSNPPHALVREFVKRFDKTLQGVAEDTRSRHGQNLEGYWPELLKKAGVTQDFKKLQYFKTLQNLTHIFNAVNDETHNGDEVEQFVNKFPEYISVVVDCLAESEKADRFWEIFCSAEITDAVQGLKDHSALFILMDILRQCENCEKLRHSFMKWLKEQFDNCTHKIKYTKISEAWEVQPRKVLNEVCEDPHFREKVLKLATDLGFPEESNQKSHLLALNRQIQESERRLPPVIHWTISGQSRDAVELQVEHSYGSNSYPVISGELSDVLRKAIQEKIPVATTKPLLQIEFEQGLYADIRTAFVKFEKNVKRSLLKNTVSGIVFCPLRTEDDKTFFAQKGNLANQDWYQVLTLNDEKRLRIMEDSHQHSLEDWCVLEELHHFYLLGKKLHEDHASEDWAEIFSVFATCILVAVAKQEADLEVFRPGAKKRVSVDDLVDGLRTRQIVDFSKSPLVFWQHEERKSSFSKNWDQPAEAVA